MPSSPVCLWQGAVWIHEYRLPFFPLLHTNFWVNHICFSKGNLCMDDILWGVWDHNEAWTESFQGLEWLLPEFLSSVWTRQRREFPEAKTFPVWMKAESREGLCAAFEGWQQKPQCWPQGSYSKPIPFLRNRERGREVKKTKGDLGFSSWTKDSEIDSRPWQRFKRTECLRVCTRMLS